MADDKMDKDLERQYRKNLMVVASIVLIYSIAGGNMGANLSLFGANLIFSHPEYLEWAMLSVMIFFGWRHWQVSRNIRFDMRKDILSKTRVSKRTLRRLDETSAAEAQVAAPSDSPRALFGHNGQGSIEISKVSTFKVCLEFCFWDDWRGELSTKKVELTILSTPFEFAFVKASYLKQWIINSIKEPHFGDGILPSITWIIALLAFLIHRYA